MSRTSLSHAQFEWREQVWVRGCPHQKDRLSFEYMKQNNSKYWFLLWWWSHRAIITFATKDFLSAGQIDSLNVSLKQNKSSLNFPLHWGSDKVLAHSSAWLTAWKKGCSVQGQQPLAPGGAGLCLSSSWELIRWQSIVIPGYPSDHPRIAQPGLSTSASRCITISCPLNKASLSEWWSPILPDPWCHPSGIWHPWRHCCSRWALDCVFKMDNCPTSSPVQGSREWDKCCSGRLSGFSAVQGQLLTVCRALNTQKTTIWISNVFNKQGLIIFLLVFVEACSMHALHHSSLLIAVIFKKWYSSVLINC